jgi:dTDP-4-dehydrorhamnose 3,5-epimerase
MQINDVILTKLNRFDDGRGWLMELFRDDQIEAQFHPQMSYISSTKAGGIRGPHEHLDQADFFCFIFGSFRIHLWDNRPKSPTFGAKMMLEAGELNRFSVLIPAGVVHAYQNIGLTDGLVLNFPNRLYKGVERLEEVDEIRHEADPNSVFRV